MDSHYRNANNLVNCLFRPGILFSLVIVWCVVVLAGSGIAIFATQHGIMSDDEIETLLSENEQLALSANVAYAEGVTTHRVDTSVSYSSTHIFPDRLVIPSIGTDLPVSNPGTRNIDALDEELKTAVVRYPDSGTLGQQNANTLIFGHSSHLPIVRNKLYKAFNDIETLSTGDRVYVYSGADVYTYQVTRVYEASASDDQIPLDVQGHRLTLLTCDTFGKKSDRFVVEAEFIGENI